MSDTPSAIMVHRSHLNTLDRFVTLGSWVLVGVLFLTVGWFAMEPDDPLGAVTVLGRRSALTMLMQAAALAGVAAALASALAGRRLADVGTFAVALGLGAVSLKGATAEYLLLQGAEASSSFERWLALKFSLEAIGWLAVTAVAVAVSAVVVQWCYGEFQDPDPAGADANPMACRTLAGFDIPQISSRWLGIPANRQSAVTDGLKHTIAATIVGLVAIALLSVGLAFRSIQHGQVCFVVAAGVCIGTYAACRIAPVRSALWSILAVGLIALLAYIWATLRPAVAGLPPNIPSSHFLRVLPIQFISVGTAAALATFWYVEVPAAGGGDASKVD
jgi:hypothetical protein